MSGTGGWEKSFLKVVRGVSDTELWRVVKSMEKYSIYPEGGQCVKGDERSNDDEGCRSLDERGSSHLTYRYTELELTRGKMQAWNCRKGVKRKNHSR